MELFITLEQDHLVLQGAHICVHICRFDSFVDLQILEVQCRWLHVCVYICCLHVCAGIQWLSTYLSGGSEVDAAHVALKTPYLISVFSQPLTPTILTTSLWIVLSTVKDDRQACRSAFNFWCRWDLGSVNDEGRTSLYSRGHIHPKQC